MAGGKSKKEALVDKIRQYEQETEYWESVEREKQEDKRRQKMIQKFRLGAKRVCAMRFWCKLEREMATDDPNKLQHLLKIRREEVYKLRRGEMSLEVLVSLLSEVGWDCWQLDPLPSLQDRAVAGFQLVLYWMNTGKTSPKHEELISEEDLIATFMLLSDEGFQELRSKDEGQWTDEEWDEIAQACKTNGYNGRQIRNAAVSLLTGVGMYDLGEDI
ncbi:MAG: hypothetical protein IH991_12515, partial [Planctomycetes bacterium]|nr:hypothetical protein [Planctomycetota bacterium]